MVGELDGANVVGGDDGVWVVEVAVGLAVDEATEGAGVPELGLEDGDEEGDGVVGLGVRTGIVVGDTVGDIDDGAGVGGIGFGPARGMRGTGPGN